MANDKNKSDNGLQSAWIRELAEILTETGLSEIEIENEDLRLRVAKQVGNTVVAAPAAAAVAAPAAAPAPVAPSAPAGNVHPGAVKSPMVGTAYLSPSPNAAPFVSEGSEVREGQTVLIVEAMKTMNPITAPKAGRVSKILVADAQPVEFDEPLIIIE